MCMADGCDPNRVSRSEDRRARKSHTCDECRRTIQAGEPYQHTSGIDYDGYAFRHRICSHCRIGAEWLGTNCGGYVMTCVAEDLAEHSSEYNRPDLQEFVDAMTAQWVGLPIPAMPQPLKLGDARIG